MRNEVPDLSPEKILTPQSGEWIPSIIVDTGKINFESDLVFNELQLNKTINSDNYVRSCYPLGGSEGRVDCNKFMMTSVSHVLKDNETCPFEPTACYPDTSSAITLESENMTFSQLGLNTKYGKDISIQRQSTCAVLDAEVFKVRVCYPHLMTQGCNTDSQGI